MKFPTNDIEWSDEVEIMIEALESESDSRELSRDEQAVLDVVEAATIMQGEEGLQDFWHSGVDADRVKRSFDMIGAAGMVDVLNSSEWCATRSDELTERETSYLAEIESEMDVALEELSELVDDFVEDME